MILWQSVLLVVLMIVDRPFTRMEGHCCRIDLWVVSMEGFC
jgi:hypothetical protein